MATVSLPYTLQAGQPENVNQLVANLNALVAGVNTVDTAQIASGAVTTAKIADAGVTADKLGATLAGQLGVSQTGTDRSVTVTQTAEISTTALSSAPITVGTSSNLTVASNGILRIVLVGELKTAGTASETAFVRPQIDTGGGTWLDVTGGSVTGGLGIAATGWSSAGAYAFLTVPQVYGTTYKTVGAVCFLPSHLQTSSNASRFRVQYYQNAGTPGTAYLKNLTATMTYIAA